jgi:hypothetical protein
MQLGPGVQSHEWHQGLRRPNRLASEDLLVWQVHFGSFPRIERSYIAWF